MGWTFPPSWLGAKNVWRPSPRPKLRSSDGLLNVTLRSRPSTRKKSPNVRPKNKKPARNLVENTPSRRYRAPETKTRTILPTKSLASCLSPVVDDARLFVGKIDLVFVSG